MHTNASSLIAGALTAILLAACSAASAPTPNPTPIRPTPPPSDSIGGGGSGGDTGIGITIPGLPWPGGDTGVQPGMDNPKLVVPKPGRLDVHPVGATKIEARVDGRHVLVRLTWWSGVEPCSVLDSVAIDVSGTTIALTIREGADQLDVACIEIALLKTTIVDLGELAPGTYAITAGGDAPPLQVTVS